MVDKHIQSIFQNLLTTIGAIYTQFETLKESWSDYPKIKMVDKTIADQITNALGECEQHLSSVLLLFSSILQIDEAGKPPHSRWIEKTTLANKKTNYILNSAQIDISNNLNNLIWSKVAGAVLTSATLTSLGSFARLNQQLGLVKEQNNTYAYLLLLVLIR